MATRLAASALGLALLLPASAAAIEHQLQGLLSFRLLATSGDPSWVEGGLGKLRFDDSDEPLDLGVALVSYRGRLAPTLGLRATVSAYDGPDQAIDLDDVYLEYRPVPRSAWRVVGKLGAFDAPLSLENTDVGWTSPYTLSWSAIGAWLGEELRTIGGEVSVTHQGAPSGSPHDLTLTGAAFRWNDPAGGLLTWRGWAVHDRRTRLFERLPLAPLPGFDDETGSFGYQEQWEEPFHEIDGRTGWYVGGQWDFAQRSRLRYHHYDNRGDPGQVGGGQWAWWTRFDHLGWHLRLPGRRELIAQVIQGDTRMDGWTGPLVYADFRAAFLLLTQQWGRQRATLRYDDFVVDDEDSTPDDPNDEDGWALTAAWFLDGPPGGAWGRWRVGVEALRVVSDRPARRLLGQDAERREDSLQLVGEWRF